jgi:hypothetical protein
MSPVTFAPPPANQFSQQQTQSSPVLESAHRVLHIIDPSLAAFHAANSAAIQQQQQTNLDNIDTVAGSLKKRLEEITASGVPAHLVVRSTEITMDKDLSSLDEKALKDLVSKLATLDVRMTKTANGLEFAWSEEDEGEGEERFDVPEEEEAEEEATQRAQQIGGRGGAGGRGGPAARGRRSGNRGRPRPRPEPLKVLDVSQIHGFGEVLGYYSTKTSL